MNRLSRLAGIAMLMTAISFPAISSAQQSVQDSSFGNDRVEAKGVGIAGGAIVGGELVVAIEGMIGVKPLWPYLTFPFLGAAGGGVGGYYLEKASPEGAVAMLIGGLALLIPTALLAAKGRAYDPREEGALDPEDENKAKFSFELPPSEEKQDADGTTSTEVESKPEGAPTQALPPPASEEQGGESPPNGESEPGEDETNEEKEATGGEGETSRNRATKQAKDELAARRRRATAGSLIFIDRDGTAGFAMPHVDIRPVQISTTDLLPRKQTGVQVFVPMLRINLP